MMNMLIPFASFMVFYAHQGFIYLIYFIYESVICFQKFKRTAFI